MTDTIIGIWGNSRSAKLPRAPDRQEQQDKLSYAICTGIHSRIFVDQGTQFGKIEPFIPLATRANVQVEATGNELHSSMGIYE
eukprot:IDg7168t1